MSTLTVEKAETKGLSVRRIIVALDLTKKCEATLDYAAKLARRYRASLCVAYVFWPRMLSEGERYYLIDKQQTEFRHELDQLVNQVRGIAPRCKSAFLVGEPAGRIAALARDSHADLIITASYQRRFIPQLLVPDKAIEIARQAPCPVLLYQEED
jgi:nucleotide-binding universal stress UspA family protein